MKPVVVIQFPGVNCEYETVRALNTAGLDARIEIYDRERVYDAKYLASRFRALVDEYRAEQGR